MSHLVSHGIHSRPIDLKSVKNYEEFEEYSNHSNFFL